jgi:sugar/nucleoside kinase (ribokinase family)
LPYVDIFLPSIEEILFMLHRKIYDRLWQKASGPNFLSLIAPGQLSDLSQELLDMGAKVVCLKLGDRGLYLRTGDNPAIERLGRAQTSNPIAWANKELWTPCFKVNVVGTTGSGDATIAGFLSALLRGLSPEEAVTIAAAVGACNVEAADSLSGLLSWEETLRRVKSGWARHDLALDASGWEFDERHHLWVASG